jgi:hypothetical protein
VAASDAAIIDYLLGLPNSSALMDFQLSPAASESYVIFSCARPPARECSLARVKKRRREKRRERSVLRWWKKLHCHVILRRKQGRARREKNAAVRPCTHSHTIHGVARTGSGASLLAGVSLENALIDPRGRPCHARPFFLRPISAVFSHGSIFQLQAQFTPVICTKCERRRIFN